MNQNNNQNSINQSKQKINKTNSSQKAKRFTRKRSTQSDRSIDSRQSKNNNSFKQKQKDITLTSINNLGNVNISDFSQNINLNSSAHSAGQIKNHQNTINMTGIKLNLGLDQFTQNIMASTMIAKDMTPIKAKYNRVRTDRMIQRSSKQFSKDLENINCHDNLNVDNQALIAELQVRNKQIQVIGSQLQCLKLCFQQETKKYKKIQTQKNQLTNQLNEKSKQFQKIQIQNKKLIQQKKMLMKQIEFLQKINYDQKTRNAQSYRQKYLQKQVQELRRKIQMSKNDLQKQLQEQIQNISIQKYNIENLNKALKVANQTLMKQLQKVKLAQKQSIFHSEQYIKLREKYKMCLDAYKSLKIQYCELQKQLNRSLSNIPQHILNSNSELSIVLSDSQSQVSLCLNKNNKSHQIVKIQSIQTAPITPIKVSLSPKSRIQKHSKSPISPQSSPRENTKTTNINKYNDKQKILSNLYEKQRKKPVQVASYRYKGQPTINNTKLKITQTNMILQPQNQSKVPPQLSINNFLKTK